MGRLTNEDHKLMGLYVYCGEQNPFAGPLTIGELAGCVNAEYSPRKILEEVFARLAAYEDREVDPENITTSPSGCVFYCNRKCNIDGDWCAEGPGCQRELTQETAMHLLELARAEKAGRLVVLPLDKVRWIKEILTERERQDRKWGCPQENTYCEWGSILTEEVGELCKELNELNFGRGDREKMKAEAVQVAAVALSILEQAVVAHEVTVKAAVALGRLTLQEAEATLERKKGGREDG